VLQDLISGVEGVHPLQTSLILQSSYADPPPRLTTHAVIQNTSQK